jgi:hypothetical protein
VTCPRIMSLDLCGLPLVIMEQGFRSSVNRHGAKAWKVHLASGLDHVFQRPGSLSKFRIESYSSMLSIIFILRDNQVANWTVRIKNCKIHRTPCLYDLRFPRDFCPVKALHSNLNV